MFESCYFVVSTYKLKSMILRIAVILIFFIGLSFSGFGQNRVQWHTLEEAVEKSKVEKRKILIDVYTDWCGWCKKMDKATFQQDKIAKYINEHYYAVKLDGEQKADIQFKEQVFKYQKSGRRGYHEFAAAIMGGKMSYPTVVFLDEQMNVIQPIQGFQNPQNFELIMTYFAGDHYKSTPWKSYQRNYKSQLAVPVRSN